MAAKKPCKSLDLDAMTNVEVLKELGRVYGNILDRLNAHLEMGEVTKATRPVPDALDAGVLLLMRVQALTTDFSYGAGGRGKGVLPTADGERWIWGLTTLEARFQDASADAAMAEAVAS